ncbi:MAG: DUF2103 domain-containing protein [Archaeoglobaceae archaeon]
MKCRNCHNELEHPGDYCLICGQSNVDLLGVYVGKRVHLFCFYDKEYVGHETISIIGGREEGGTDDQIAYRNTLDLISDCVHKKRPQTVITSGIDPSTILKLWDCEVFYTRDFDNPEDFKQAVAEYLQEKRMEKVDIRPEKKVSGRHYTVIGGRNGQRTLREIGCSSYVKKIVPGPIEVSRKSQGGFTFKIQKPDSRGNLRLRLREGSTVQEIRLVTTAYDESSAQKVVDELNARLASWTKIKD